MRRKDAGEGTVSREGGVGARRVPVGRLWAVVAAVLAAGVCGPVWAGTPRIRVEPEQIDLGWMYFSQVRRSEIRVFNDGDGPLRIVEIRGSCSCTVPEFREEDRIIPPGQSRPLTVEVKPKTRKAGPLKQRVEIESNDPQRPVVRVAVEVEVRLGVEAEPAGLVFRDLLPRDVREERITLRSTTGEAFRITGATVTSPVFEVQYDPQGEDVVHTVYVSVEGQSVESSVQSTLTLRTTHSISGTIEVPLRAVAAQRLVVLPRYWNFGLRHPGEVVQKEIRVQSRLDRQIQWLRVELPEYPQVQTRVVRDETDAERWVVLMRVPEDWPAGRIVSTPFRLVSDLAEEGGVSMGTIRVQVVSAGPVASGDARGQGEGR